MKKLLWLLLSKGRFLRRPTSRYCAEQVLLWSVILETNSDQLRRALFLPGGSNTTHLNQDIFALLVNKFRQGYFIEIGANDGVTLSNTLFLEEYFAWDGLLIEANPKYEESLISQRRAKVVMAAIGPLDGSAQFSDSGLYGGLVDTLDESHQRHTRGSPTIRVNCSTIDSLFASAHVPRIVDFISVDVEGAELIVVEQLMSQGTRHRCGCVEVNDRRSDIEKITTLLEGQGYEILTNLQSRQDLFFVDPDLALDPARFAV